MDEFDDSFSSSSSSSADDDDDDDKYEDVVCQFQKKRHIARFNYSLGAWRAYLILKRKYQANYSKAICHNMANKQKLALNKLRAVPSYCLHGQEVWSRCERFDLKKTLSRAFNMFSFACKSSVNKPKIFRRRRVLSATFGEWQRSCYEDMQVSIAANKVAEPHYKRYSKCASFVNLKYHSQCSRILRNKYRLALVFRVFRNCRRYLTIWRNYVSQHYRESKKNKSKFIKISISAGENASTSRSRYSNNRNYNIISSNSSVSSSRYANSKISSNGNRAEVDDDQSFIDALNSRRSFRIILNITRFRKFIIQKHKVKLSDCIHKWKLWKNRLVHYDMSIFGSAQSLYDRRFVLFRKFVSKIKSSINRRCFVISNNGSSLDCICSNDYGIGDGSFRDIYLAKLAIRKLSKFIMLSKSRREEYDKTYLRYVRVLKRRFFRKIRLFIVKMHKFRSQEASSLTVCSNAGNRRSLSQPLVAPEISCHIHSLHRVFIAFIRYSISMARTNARNSKLLRFIEVNYKLRRYYEVFDMLAKLRNQQHNSARVMKLAFLFSKNYLKSKLFAIIRNRLNQFKMVSSSNSSSCSSSSSSRNSNIVLSASKRIISFKYSFLSQRGQIVGAQYYIDRRRKQLFFVKFRRFCRKERNKNDGNAEDASSYEIKLGESTGVNAADKYSLSSHFACKRSQKFKVSLLCWKLYRYRSYLAKWRQHVKKRVDNSSLYSRLIANYDMSLKKFSIKQCLMTDKHFNPNPAIENQGGGFSGAREKGESEQSFYYYKDYFNLWKRNFLKAKALKCLGLRGNPSEGDSNSANFQKNLNLSKKLLNSISVQMSSGSISEHVFNSELPSSSSVYASLYSSSTLLKAKSSGDMRQGPGGGGSGGNVNAAIGIYSNLFQSNLAAEPNSDMPKYMSSSYMNTCSNNPNDNLGGILTEVNSSSINLARTKPRSLNPVYSSLKSENFSLGLNKFTAVVSASSRFESSADSSHSVSGTSHPTKNLVGLMSDLSPNNPNATGVLAEVAANVDICASADQTRIRTSTGDEVSPFISSSETALILTASNSISSTASASIKKTPAQASHESSNKVKLAKEILKFAQDMQHLLEKI